MAKYKKQSAENAADTKIAQEQEHTRIGADINAQVAQQESQGKKEQEEQIQTSAFLDDLMSDARKIAVLLGAIIFFAGSYVSFWGVISDEGRLSQGSLFAGYMFGGFFGKLCFCMVLSAFISICIHKEKLAWYLQVLSVVALLIQIILIIVWGRNITEAMGAYVYPGLGSFICILGDGIMTFYVHRLNKN